jgi:hypothetical protein
VLRVSINLICPGTHHRNSVMRGGNCFSALNDFEKLSA